MRSLLRLFITLLDALRWLIDMLLWCLAIIVLLQFAAQFEHPVSWDATWPVVKLEEWGDPLLATIGSWFFMLEEGDPAVWPADEVRYFPLVVIIGVVLLHIGVMKVLVPAIRKGRAVVRSAKGKDPVEVPTTVPQAAVMLPGQTPMPPGPGATTRPSIHDPATHPGSAFEKGETLLLQPDDTLVTGSFIGRYQIQRELGRGAMGVVYKAQDPSIGRVVAIKKILTGKLTPDELTEYRTRFLTEAQAAGKITHPGIIGVYDVLEDEGQTFIVMEFVEGTTLEELVAKERLSLGKSLEVMLQVAEALGFAHGEDIIHRDMKPANILVTAGGTVKIADFGIAKMVGTKLTRTGQIMGTPVSMSPEQFQGHAADARSDVFSLGSMMYWLVTGEQPFPGDSITAIAYKVVQTNSVPARKIDPTLPPEIDLIISKCLKKNPDNRYANAAELCRDLEAFRDGRALSVEEP